ncbi:hypothetical protein LOTGIDRAFT_160843 [Lottia gigantea]|uniref:MARVEL domain-containing protein n=1 Tax=Lottia gigantea TaxID=225164 RepID=V4C0U8_LOTGI|nr:hypothetical protein LOTGIDRAFT_160843 [Lottia gigantea]ESO95079.1 hypothetical protein LOTGIDRAFT_160843 [Lottia gigantea]
MVGPLTPRRKKYPPGPRSIRDVKPTPKPRYRIENIQQLDRPPNIPSYQRSIIQDVNFGVVRGKPVDPFNKKQRDARSISPPSPRPQYQNTDVTKIKFLDDDNNRYVRPNNYQYRRSSDPGTPRNPRNNRRGPPSPRPIQYRRASDPETPRLNRRQNRRPPPSPRQRSFQSLPDRRLHTGSQLSSERRLQRKRDPKNKNSRKQYYDDADALPNIPMRQTGPNNFPPRPIFVEKSPEAVAVIPTSQARFTPDMNRVRQKTFAYSETKRNFPVHIYRDPDRLVEGAKYPDGICCGALNSTFLITIWGFLKILQLICCIVILVCAVLEGLQETGIFWVIFVAALGIIVSLGTLVFHLARGHLKESRCVLFTEFTLYLFMSLCVLSAAIIATLNSEFTDTITCITIVGFIATLLFGVDTIITGSWIGARTYVPPSMRPGPIRYPPNYQPKVYYPRARKEVIYDSPQILLDPWEKKIHYNDYRPSRYNFNLNNPRDPRLPDRVDVRYIQNKPRYLKPLYRREYRFPEERFDYEYDDVRTAPVRRYQPREVMDGFRSFPDQDFRRYQSLVMKPILHEDDLLCDDSRTHVTVFNHREYDKRPFPRLYNNYRRRNWRVPEFDDFTSENELDSNMPSRGSNDFSLNPNYHKRRDYRVPNFKNYDDWRIQKHRARQLSTIPAKPRLRREHFWSVDSIPSDRKRRREYPNFKTYEDWNIPRDRFSISSVPNRFPEKDDYQSSFGPFESKVGENFSTTPFPDRSLVDTSSLIRPYRPKPRRDPDLQEQKSINSRNDPVPGVPGNRSIVQDRISNRDSDIASLDANRSTNSQRMKPIFNKEKEPKARKSVGSV